MGESGPKPAKYSVKNLIVQVALIVCFTFIGAHAAAQNKTNSLPDNNIVRSVVDSLASQITRYYVDMNDAQKMSAFIKKRFREGKYKTISDEHVLAGQLTSDLRSVRADEHLHVEFNPQLAYELSGEVEDVPGMVADKLRKDREQNFGFRKAEVLNGNIGYLELSGFSRLNMYSKAAADAALQMLSNARVIIIDLRYGVGGSPDMMTHILSHFYRDKMHVSDVYIRSEKATLSYYTTPDSAYGPLYDMPLYVLTSYKTFSAAEGLAYALQTTKRATIVGEVTRGGAHTVAYRPLGKGFVCDIPFGEAISPLTKKNWEKTGIRPDVAVKAEDALERTELFIFDQALASAKDSAESRKLRMQRDLLLSKNHPVTFDSTSLKGYAGNYGPYCVSYESSCLYYQKTGKARFPLLPMSATTMRARGIDNFLIEFQKDKEGKISGITTHFDDGHSEYAARNR